MSLELAEWTIGEANDLKAEIIHLGEEIASMRKSLEDIWTGHCSAVYELVSVFIHRGEHIPSLVLSPWHLTQILHELFKELRQAAITIFTNATTRNLTLG